jgi:hypothetical protein
MRADIVPRAVFPDYELTGHAAKPIVASSRGGYCPKDRLQQE